MEKMLTVSKLTVLFDGKPTIDDLSFELAPGESLAIIGPNGAGKTVLLRTLLGTIGHSGQISWAPGVRLGYVPQKIEADRHLPINVQNLLHAKASILRLPLSEVAHTIKSVGLGEDILKTPVGHLSGGQFQRALIAFALLGKPNVLILDEPTASIDKPGEERVYELVYRLQKELQMAVILVSHDLNFVYRYASKVLCLNRTGVCFGSPEEALTPAVLEKLYGPHEYFHDHRNGHH